MCPTFTPGGYVSPGAYVEVKNVALPNVQPGPRVGAITGTGKITKNVLREELTLTRVSDILPFIGTLANVPIIDLLENSAGEMYVTDSAGKVFYGVSGTISSGYDFGYIKSTGVITWGYAAGTAGSRH